MPEIVAKPLSSRLRASLFLVAILPLTGCLFRTRTVERRMSTAPLKTATQAQLIGYINNQDEKVRSMNATVDIDTSVGGEKKGKTTDYTEIRGYILARKPAMLRMIGLLPIVRNKAFDMVSNGSDFKLWIPPKNRFVEGRNDVTTPNAKQPLENIRPQHIYEALLLHGIDPKTEIAVMENDFEEVTDSKGHKVRQPDYEIDVIRQKDHGGWYLSRKIIFSRIDLLPHRQIAYDESGSQSTDTFYENYKDYDSVNFPSQIEIRRPQEEYDIVLHILKLQLNEALKDDQFQLEQPPGAQIIHLDQPQAARSSKDAHGSGT
jgi:outer membrane lipoprotein-sorting protein